MIQKWLPLLFSAVAMTLSIATFFKSDAPHTAASDGGTFSSSTRRKLQSFEESTDSIDSATFTLNTIQHKRRGFRRTGETHACDLSGQCPAGVQGSQGDKGNDGPPGERGEPGYSGSGRGLFVVTQAPFNAVGDGVADDTSALQSAIDAAAEMGGRVHLPAATFLITTPLVVPSGVSVVGIGAGDDPRNANSVTGSVIKYCGDDYAMIFRSDNAGGRDFVIVDHHLDDCPSAKGALLLEATEERPTIESNLFSNILIFRFTGGTGLTLRAVRGGIAYNQFYDLRIRYAKRGIHIVAPSGAEAFVNSNHFHGGAISGTPSDGMDFGVLNEGTLSPTTGRVNPANQNTFNAMTIEPSKTLLGHVVVRGPAASVALLGCRLEASKQDADVPIVYVAPESGGTIITDTMVGHRHVVADLLRNPGIKVWSGKTLTHAPSLANRLLNPSFHPENVGPDNVDEAGAGVGLGLEHWEVELNGVKVQASEHSSSGLLTFAADPTIDGSSGQNAAGNAAGSSTSSVESNSLFPGFHPLTVTIPAGALVTLSPVAPTMQPYPVNVAFGVYTAAVVVDGEDLPAVRISATMRGPSGGMLSSSPQPADGNWRYLGLHAEQSTSVGAAAPAPTIRLNNSLGVATATVVLTAPSLGYGVQVVAGEAALQSTGGLMAGTLTLATVPVILNSCALTASAGRLTLPVRGNVFDIGCHACDDDHPTCSISRINAKTGDRFLPGTIITLLLPEATSSGVGRVSFIKGAYIDLLSQNGQPATGRWTLTLVAGSSGTWREISRATADQWS